MNKHREPCAHSDVVRSSLPFNSGDECLWGWSRGGGLHVIVVFGLGAKWCDGVGNKHGEPSARSDVVVAVFGSQGDCQTYV
jgi:hypothetical protein